MKQKHVIRNPMPSEEDISSLPSVAKTVLNMFEGKIENSEFKYLARSFVDASNGKEPNFGPANVRYSSTSVYSLAKNLSKIGEYNPDKIPISVYEKMRLDPQIALATALIELPILAQNYRIECLNKRVKAVVETSIKKIYRKLVKSLLRSVQFGFVTGEKVWEQVKLKIVEESEQGKIKVIHNGYTVIPKKIKFIHPSSVKIIRNEDTEDIEYVTQSQNYYNNFRMPKVKIQDMVWFALDDEYGNFFGNSRYKNSYQAWYFYHIVLQFMLKYLERRGGPAAVGKAPPGQTEKSNGEKVSNIDIMMEAANALVSNSAVALPSQYDKHGNDLWDLKLIEDEQRGELFLDALRFLNYSKMRGMFVPDKVATAEGSSTNSTTEGHTDIHLLNEESLIQLIEECINEQLIKDIVDFNFPTSKRIPCYIKIERLNYSKKTLLKDVLTRMLMLYSSSIREGNWPNWMPSVKEISKFLEIPGSETPNQFINDILKDIEQDKNVDNGSRSGKISDNDPLSIKDKKDQRNKDAVPRKEVSRRDRRSKERI